MKDELFRFGVAMESSLLEELDAIVAARGSTRSEVLRDLVRGEVIRRSVSRGGTDGVATVTLVYDHHVRDVTEKLNELQHDLGDRVISTLHIHLDHDHCMEVILMKGPIEVLKDAASKLLGTRGVKHGGIELIPTAKKKPVEHHELPMFSST